MPGNQNNPVTAFSVGQVVTPDPCQVRAPPVPVVLQQDNLGLQRQTLDHTVGLES